MNAPIRTYRFHQVDRCPMCAAPIGSSRILGLRLDRSQGFNPRGKSGAAVTVHRCAVCDLVYSNPEPRPTELDDHYDIPVESYWNENQLSSSIDMMSRPLVKTKELLDFRPGMKALDVGTGIGLGFTALEKAGFDAWAIEPSRPFRAKALELTGAAEHRLALASLESADFPEKFFDYVTLGGVFEHLYDPAAALQRCMRLLRPGGIFYAEVPSPNWLIGRIINAYFKAIGTSFVTNLSPMHSPFHIHEFTHKTFETYGRTTGSSSVGAYEYEVCPIRHFPSPLHPLMRKLMARTDTGLQLHVWLRRAS